MAKHMLKSKTNKNKKEPRSIATLFFKIIVILVLVIFTGTLGFMLYEGTNWVDSFQNAVFVFSTTGIATPTKTYKGKIYSSIYNIITSLFVIVIITALFLAAVENDFIGDDSDSDSSN